jgi:hypothetical protein
MAMDRHFPRSWDSCVPGCRNDTSSLDGIARSIVGGRGCVGQASKANRDMNAGWRGVPRVGRHHSVSRGLLSFMAVLSDAIPICQKATRKAKQKANG